MLTCDNVGVRKKYGDEIAASTSAVFGGRLSCDNAWVRKKQKAIGTLIHQTYKVVNTAQ